MVSVQQYGCFVALNSRTQGLVHVSELDVKRVSNPADLFSEGDLIDVKVLEKNQKGQLRLSRLVKSDHCSHLQLTRALTGILFAYQVAAETHTVLILARPAH